MQFDGLDSGKSMEGTEQMPVSQLVAPERNVRVHTQVQVNELVRSVRMFGQIRPIVIDENNVVLAGNGLTEAIKILGWETAGCLRMVGLSENDKKKLMLADNKIFSIGMDASQVQFDFIREIGDLDIPGFDEDVIRTLTAGVQEVTDQINTYGSMLPGDIEKRENAPAAPAGSTEAPRIETTKTGKNIRCPHCGEGIWIP